MIEVVFLIGLLAVLLALIAGVLLLLGVFEILGRLDLRVKDIPRHLVMDGKRRFVTHTTGEVLYPDDEVEKVAQAAQEAAIRHEAELDDQARRAAEADEPPALG